MKLLIAFALVVMVTARPEGSNDSKYDDVDIDEVINNDILLKAYAHCFIGTGECTSDGAYIKDQIADTINDLCAKCSEKQKTLIAKSINALKAKTPEEYKILNSMYNPDNKQTAALEEFLAKFSS